MARKEYDFTRLLMCDYDQPDIAEIIKKMKEYFAEKGIKYEYEQFIDQRRINPIEVYYKVNTKTNSEKKTYLSHIVDDVMRAYYKVTKNRKEYIG